MARPDPHAVTRLPMARARGGVARARTRSDITTGRALFADGQLDVDVLYERVDAAEAVAEARVYEAQALVGGGAAGQEVALGSAMLTFRMVDGTEATALAAVLGDDPRARRSLDDRVAREAARLLGPAAPSRIETSYSTRVDGDRLLVDVDFEGPLGGPRPSPAR